MSAGHRTVQAALEKSRPKEFNRTTLVTNSRKQMVIIKYKIVSMYQFLFYLLSSQNLFFDNHYIKMNISVWFTKFMTGAVWIVIN
jgi:hypothetical protein